MTTFIKPDISRINQYNAGLAFEQLTKEERLSYFRKASNIMKLKNNKVVPGEDNEMTEYTYHDDFFVYYSSIMGNASKGTGRAILAIPRDVVKYAFYTKVGNKLHEAMKEDCEIKSHGELKRALTMVRIICGETGINVPMYYYNLDKNFIYTPFQYDSGIVNAMVPKSTADSDNSGNVDLGWIGISTDQQIHHDDIPKFFYHDEMNVPLLFATVRSATFHRIMKVMERVLLKKNFVVDVNTVEDESIAQVLFEDVII